MVTYQQARDLVATNMPTPGDLASEGFEDDLGYLIECGDLRDDALGGVMVGIVTKETGRVEFHPPFLVMDRLVAARQLDPLAE